jgi:ribosome maturation factor RimP
MGYFHLVTPFFPMVHSEQLSGFDFIEEEVLAHGAQLVELAIRGERGGKVVEVFVDSEKGVTTELCAELSRTIGERLDNDIKGSYHLVVSSPGADRPLKFPWQYQKHIGRPVSITARSGQITGVLASIDGDGIHIEQPKNKGMTTIPFSDIVEGRVQLPW